MCPTRRTARIRNLGALAAVIAAVAGAAPPTASAESTPVAGSSQTCVGATGGFLLKVNGFGLSFAPYTTATTTFTLSNGDVVTLTATTDQYGTFRTEPFTLDLRDPEDAALIGTWVHETAVVGGVESSLSFTLVGCPTQPDGRVACLDGGFESYPQLGFLNQGDCISWVATNGKNEPGQNTP
ncbi:MAG TPA: hypothetical protein VF712_01665 [Thermoleophilaceae bacterium]|jgi:hypothetical protein